MNTQYPKQPYLLRLTIIFSIFLSAFIPLRPIYAQAKTPTTTLVDHAGGGRNQIEVTLIANQEAVPGSIVTLRFDAKPWHDAPDLVITWNLPNGGELIDGPATESLGAIKKNQIASSSRQVRFPSEGVYQVGVVASYKPLPTAQYAAAGVLFFTVKTDGTASVSDKDPSAVSAMGSEIPVTVEQSVQPADVHKVNGDPCFNVTGHINRIDKRPNPNTDANSNPNTGYDPDKRVPVRNAKVTMKEEDTLFDDSYGEQTTDINGNFSFSFCDDDGWFDDKLELYVELRAEIKSGVRKVVEVEDSSWIDEVYEFKSGKVASDGGNITIEMNLTEAQSEVFNIGDAILDAWNVWNANGGAAGDDAIFDYSAEVHWEPGYGDADSYYEGYIFDEITIADDPSDSDQWDDSVIMHEWTHIADDKYGCDDNPGGDHFMNQLTDDTELAWGEGYPNYNQSAIRRALGVPNSNFYLDNIYPNSPGIVLDLENFSPSMPSLFSEFYENAIAAMLWDLNDATNDGQDRVSVGLALLQQVYTDPTFASNGNIFDDTCDVRTYLKSWRDMGKSTDAPTAAAVTQNIGLSNPFAVLAADANQTASTHDDLTIFADNPTSPDYKWWKQLTLITDRSHSMEGVKFNTVKSVLNEQISDVSKDPKGVEFSLSTFDNTSNNNQIVLKGEFFADQIVPQVNALNTNPAADPNCQVQALSAMAQTLAGKKGGDAWLFTDGDTTQNISVETLVQQLNEHQVKGSFALLGGCASVPSGSNNTSGAEQNFLGAAANGSQPGGIVPYLLTAIGSGGQFLFVDQSKINEAVDIMRAQLKHNAGAGRWSDYVSDQPTYRYDKLTSWEYNWLDASLAAGGVLVSQNQITLPQPFIYYGAGPFTAAYTNENGYITLGNDFSSDGQDHTTLPNPVNPNNTLYPFWNNINRRYEVCPVAIRSSALFPMADFYTKQVGDWFVIETNTFRCFDPIDVYQVLLNTTNGEIRYQYKSITDVSHESRASESTIGLENAAGTAAVQVSYNDINGASNGMGYKFTPAPPQPSRTYTVEVDSLMSGIGFLLTGFSGDFDPLVVQYPDGTSIDCADTAHVLCLNLGLVQYVQADVNGHTGVWSATISTGPSGMGTFNFSSMAVSAINVQSSGDRSLSSTEHVLRIDLDTVVDGGLLDGWFLKPNGDRFGDDFKFYDDGTHNDGRAGDGEFASDPFNAPSGGAAYLQVRGTVGGVNFVRTDSTPYTFQPLEVKALGNGFNFGDVTTLQFQITNLDSVQHCYDRFTQVPEGWTFDWHMNLTEAISGICLNPGISTTLAVDVKLSADPINNLPSGTSGEVLINFIEKEEGKISNSDSTLITRYRDVATIKILNKSSSSYLRANGVDTTTLTIFMHDEQGVSVADGTPINLSTTLGAIIPPQGFTKHGQVEAIFTASSTEGNAIVTASSLSQSSIAATTTIHIHTPLPDRLDLMVEPTMLITGVNSSEVTATVKDAWGKPVTNQTVRIGVETDGQIGAINDSEVYTIAFKKKIFETECEQRKQFCAG